MSPTPSITADRTSVEFPTGAEFRSVGRLVLGGIASRFELPIDRVDDLLLALESVLLQETNATTVRRAATASTTGLSVRIGPFAPEALRDPSLLRVLGRLVDEVVTEPDADETSIELLVTAPYRYRGV